MGASAAGLTLGHLYRFEELSGKSSLEIDTNGVKDLGLLLWIMAGEPEEPVHQHLQRFPVADLNKLTRELGQVLGGDGPDPLGRLGARQDPG